MCSQPGAKPLLHGYFMLRIRSQEQLKTMYRTQPRPARPALLPLRSDALAQAREVMCVTRRVTAIADIGALPLEGRSILPVEVTETGIKRHGAAGVRRDDE